MSNPAIRACNLAKKFELGELVTTRDLARLVRRCALAPLRLLGVRPNDGATPSRDFWALRDISFQINQGEKVGIIGRNGAGKSTLLKILSRITAPTRGRVELFGRVAALLEVGTGFHPELTGRENIYLNGAILGMTRQEVRGRFDDIVQFAGVETFLDTPIKRYSSGMRVRLGFAVAAHLEPEILIVDEVLAVGDAEFQKRCLGKMGEVARSGRTVLFVSHNMMSIESLCDRGIVLDGGRISFDGASADAVKIYLEQHAQTPVPVARQSREEGGEELRVMDIVFEDTLLRRPLSAIQSGQDVTIRIHYANLTNLPLRGVSFGLNFYDSRGARMFGCLSSAVRDHFVIPPGNGSVEFRIPRWPLQAGRFRANCNVNQYGKRLDRIVDAVAIEVEDGDFFGLGRGLLTNQGVLVDFECSMPAMGAKSAAGREDAAHA